MSRVELRPGQVLSIVWNGTQDTPFGERGIESKLDFSYEELIEKLSEKIKRGRASRPGTIGSRVSRMVTLSTNAIRRGVWSTGAPIEKEVAFEKLIGSLESLVGEGEVTPKARESLEEILRERVLNLEQKKKLKALLQQVSPK